MVDTEKGRDGTWWRQISVNTEHVETTTHVDTEKVIHREGKDSSFMLSFQHDWQAAHCMTALRGAGEWCPLRSESGLLKVRYKEDKSTGRSLSNAYVRVYLIYCLSE